MAYCHLEQGPLDGVTYRFEQPPARLYFYDHALPNPAFCSSDMTVALEAMWPRILLYECVGKGPHGLYYRYVEAS